MTFTLNIKPFHRNISKFDSDMESDEDTGGEDVVAQDPPVQADHSEKNSHKKKKKTKEDIKDEKRELHRQALEVDLSSDPASDQFEADMEEAVLRSLKDRSQETDHISQPGCSHWSISQPQTGPVPQFSA